MYYRAGISEGNPVPSNSARGIERPLYNLAVWYNPATGNSGTPGAAGTGLKAMLSPRPLAFALCRRVKNTAAAIIATPRITPTTIPAIAPPLSPLCELPLTLGVLGLEPAPRKN
jgi:hypothetical protein